MPSILSRFKRSPSTSSSHSEEPTQLDGLRNSHHTFQVTRNHNQLHTPKRSLDVASGSSSISDSPTNPGSSFVEVFDAGSERERERQRPAPLAVPLADVNPGGAGVGTPKLTISGEGASPRSLATDSPISRGSPVPHFATRGLGMGMDSQNASRRSSAFSEDLETPTVNSTHQQFVIPKPTSTQPIQPPHSAPPSIAHFLATHLEPSPVSNRDRSNSIASSHHSQARPHSLIERLKHHKDSESESTSLLQKVKKKRRKHRTGSTSSQTPSLAALVKSGLHIASPTDGDSLNVHGESGRKRASSRGETGSIGVNGEDDEAEDDESDSDGDEHLPVTGFAVASHRRQADFHHLFAAVDAGDYLIEDYGCALHKEILVQGRLYISENHLCFHAKFLGWTTDVVVSFTDIKQIEKKMTALVIPNAIGVSTADAKYTFASLISRDSTFDVMMNIWRLCNPNAVMSTISFQLPTSIAPSTNDDTQVQATPSRAATLGATAMTEPSGSHAPTECACGKAGQHHPEIAMETTFPGELEKVHNLMFASEWHKTFMSENQKLREIEMSPWLPRPVDPKLQHRSLTYIKPLNGSIGPKQTKCHLTDEQEHCDFNDYVSVCTTTRTPDVPSGGVFSVKTRSCLTWAVGGGTKVVVSTCVDWTGKSWVKGIIEKSAIEGQRQYHVDLESGIRAHIKSHPEEFNGPETSLPPSTEGQTTTTSTTFVAGQGVDTQSEAEKYAAKHKAKASKGVWGMLDNLSLELNKETVLGGLVVVLLISNIWTWFKPGHGKGGSIESRKGRIAERAGKGNGETAGAMRTLMRGRLENPEAEARELMRILDGVEERAQKLRSAVRSVEKAVRTGTGGVGQDLDVGGREVQGLGGGVDDAIREFVAGLD